MTDRLDADRPRQVSHVASPAAALPPGSYGEWQTLQFLQDFGLPTADGALAGTPQEAATVAETLGYPVVVKLSAPAVLHKTEVGGVRLGLTASEAVRDVAKGMLNHHLQDAQVLVQRQHEGIECIIGIRRDQTLGSAIVFGSGGTAVELIEDVAMDMAPLSREDVLGLIHNTTVGRVIEQNRQGHLYDADLLAEVISKVSQLAIAAPEIAELDLNPVILSQGSAVVVDARMRIERPRVQHAFDGVLPKELLEPEAVVVVGASTSGHKPGARVIEYLLKHGFEGQIIPVNPKGGIVGGIPAVQTLEEIPENVDVACIAVPATDVPNVLRSLANKGVRSAVVFSSGFAEAGTEGSESQKELKAVTDEIRSRLRFCGPNSIGIISPRSKTALSFAGALELDEIMPGSLAFVSQSGAIASALLSRAWERQIGFSRWISTGNELDLEVADYLNYLAEDDATQAVILFLESIKNGERFRVAARRCLLAGKPVIVYKTGRSEAGREAVMSHTGALAGEDEVYDAFFRSCGVVRVNTLEQLLDTGSVLTRWSAPTGERVGILTMSGGAASVIADRCVDLGLSVPRASSQLQERLRESVPAYGSVTNPIDATVDAATQPQLLIRAAEEMVLSGEFDLILCQLTTNADPGASAIAEGLVRIAHDAPIPFLVARFGAEALATHAMKLYREEQYVVLDAPESLVETAAGMIAYGKLVRRLRAIRPN